MLASLLYVALRRVLQLVVVCCRSREFKELEIVVLRHELGIFAGRSDGPRFDPPIERSWPPPAASSRAGAGARSS